MSIKTQNKYLVNLFLILREEGNNVSMYLISLLFYLFHYIIAIKFLTFQISF